MRAGVFDAMQRRVEPMRMPRMARTDESFEAKYVYSRFRVLFGFELGVN